MLTTFFLRPTRCNLMRPQDVPHRIFQAKFAAMGDMLARANAMTQKLNEFYSSSEDGSEIQKGEVDNKEKKNPPFPFKRKSILRADIGNVQGLGNIKPYSFVRNVIALAASPELLNSKIVCEQVMKPDVVEHAKWVLKQMPAGSCGSYTDPAGCLGFRKQIAKFITERDRASAPKVYSSSLPRMLLEQEVSEKSIILTNGATDAISLVMTLSTGDCRYRHGIMVGAPSYPVYESLQTVLETKPIPYFMDERHGWSFSRRQLDMASHLAFKKGIRPMAAVFIDPGNPTGSVLSRETKKEALQFCIDMDLTAIADEVYFQTIWEEGGERGVFHSFREVLFSEFPPEIAKKCRLVSLNSVSKSGSQDCGIRGGYLQYEHLDPIVQEQLLKLATITNINANTVGQISTTLMCMPLKPSDPSYEQDQKEKKAFHDSMKAKSILLTKELNEIPGIVCQKVSGAFYAMPRLFLPSGFKHEAKKKGRLPDEHFCVLLLEQFGVLTVPGSGFGDRAGTYHFRTTMLPPLEEMEYLVESVRELMKVIREAHGEK